MNIDWAASPNCDFCQSPHLRPVYEVPESPLGMRVAVCQQCGLVCSLPQREKAEAARMVTTSSDANWGNIRHGKGLRLKATAQILEQVPWQQVRRVLDVGSNRGDFVHWLFERKPDAEIEAIEPDERIVNGYRTLAHLSLHPAKLEAVALPANEFNFVYCSHTLEHAASASAMLRQIHAACKSGGWLFLEVPNLEAVTLPEIVEEFFIDKHRFHFNRKHLMAFLQQLGFAVRYEGDDKDIFNITLLLQKVEQAAYDDTLPAFSELARRHEEIIADYAARLRTNRLCLKRVSDNLHAFMARQKVAFWGAGRIFDALVRYGGLQTGKLCCVVDEYLSKILPEIHQVKIREPNYLKSAQPDVIVVLARSSTTEIIAQARRLGFKKIIHFADLLSAAR